MKNSSLLEILRNLPKDSLRALDKFVHSPFHVTHQGVVALYEYLQGHLPEDEVEKETVAEALFPGNPDGIRKLYHLTNYLLEAVEHFLALESWEEEPHERNLATLRALRRMRLENAFTRMQRYTQKQLQTAQQRGGAYYRAEHALHMESYYASLHQGRAKLYNNVQELSETQDIALICEKLRTGCLLQSHQSLSSKAYDNGLTDSILQFLDGHRYLQIPAVAVYYHGYYAQLGGPQSDFHFQSLKKMLDEHATLFSLADMHDLFLMAINFGIRRANQSDERYVREIFELYQSGLRHGALLEDGQLSRWTYNNITGTALRLQEYAWVHKFLEEYASYLPESHREGTFYYNMARYYYDTRDLRKAMEALLYREHDDIFQNLTAKVMLCKIYFELNELEALDSQIDSVRIYIRRNKLIGYHRDNYLNVTRLMRKLLALPPAAGKAARQLREEIEQTPVLSERVWFLKQLSGVNG